MATISKYQNTSGATLYRVRYRTPDGRQTDKRGFAVKRDADAFAATVEVSKLRGEYVAPSVGRVTVGELGPAWLARQQGHAKPSSYRTYESEWRIHIAPRWGAVKVSAVCFSDVQAWVSDMSERVGPSTVRGSYGVLYRILEDATRDRILPGNPARGVKLPARAKPRHIYLTKEQLNMLANESGTYRSLVLLLGIGGLRWGEAAALTAADVDWLHRRIHLSRNAVQVGGTVIMGTLKTGDARTVGLPEFVIQALSATAAGKGRDELLWSTAAGKPMGPPTESSWLDFAVRRCMATDETFPRITAHALRHTAASLAISAGVNVKVLQRMLGHKSAAMTLDVYADLFESDAEALAENLGKMWANVGSAR